MKKFHKLAFAGLAAGSLIAGAGSASAAITYPTGSTGFDGQNQVITGGGSDTTFYVENLFATLYSASAGCTTNNTSGLRDRCQDPQTAKAGAYADFDHDIISPVYPTGSGAGIGCLKGTATCGVPLNFARSSRPPTNAEMTTGTQVAGWAYAKDGVDVTGFSFGAAGRTSISVTKAQLQGIYNCSAPKTWQDLGDTGPHKTDPVIPVGMNSASGTYATFQAYLGFDPNAGACVHKQLADSNNDPPFENDAKQLETDSAFSADYAAGKLIWWMSNGAYSNFPYLARSAAAVTVDGVAPSLGTIADNSYPLTRFLWRVTTKADAVPGATPLGTTNPGTDLTGTTVGGAGGGVREFTKWTCATKANQAISDISGKSFFDEIASAITKSGFQAVPGAERNFGRCQVLLS